MLVAAFVLANIFAGIKVSYKYRVESAVKANQVKPPMAAGDFALPTSQSSNTVVTKQAIARIACPKPLAAADFSVQSETVKSAELDWGNYSLTDKDKKHIELSYLKGVNLAGHYHLASWSCGQDCQTAAIINAKTGRLIAFGADDDLQSTTGWKFSATSSLLAINPNSQNKDNPTIYALIEDQGLRRICYLAQ